MPSHVIRRFRYDYGKSQLEIVFVSGRRYLYHDVPVDTFAALQSAFAKGQFFGTHIRPKFRYTRLGESAGVTMRAVLFDIDGTLVDSNEFHVQAWSRAFDAAGHEVSPSAIRQHIGMGADMLIPALLPDAGEEIRQQMARTHDDVFRKEYLSQVRPFAAATELIRVLSEVRGYTIMLASSAKQNEVDHYVELLGISDYLLGTTSADDVNHSKPAGDIFAAAMKKLHDVPPHEACVVGDTPYDVLAATKCSIPTIAVLSGGFTSGQLRQAGAISIYDDVSDLLQNLDRSPICQPGESEVATAR